MLGKRAEDYLEAIYELCREKGFTRVKDIAERLNVKPATVSEMLEKLSKGGYIIYRKRLFVALTEKGRKVARDVRERREILVKFLTALGIPKDIAEKDACTIEHVLHSETVKQLKNFVKFIEECPAISPKWLEHFREFCRTGIHPCDRAKSERVKRKALNV
ncbi:metal-dependent transcriptional regulator [Archaeoglobus profundus]|uniref:Iron (Metal) dependent repressor, DtxR family n=1 Tax=Archaeoglobus profundus (strain DSM 5631 / JCM 9629 / NBRC 100127 / Av18) TaxID=572546 RepID=D2RG02_ARCPA|nr:metal-dependent transcriptional regulator [Archaeoglobus profundus]ADB57227.1 iron (metal) dependent repressor, DtxR family [Archaeoglobus profundus DSM 5631]